MQMYPPDNPCEGELWCAPYDGRMFVYRDGAWQSHEVK